MCLLEFRHFFTHLLDIILHVACMRWCPQETHVISRGKKIRISLLIGHMFSIENASLLIWTWFRYSLLHNCKRKASRQCEKEVKKDMGGNKNMCKEWRASCRPILNKYCHSAYFRKAGFKFGLCCSPLT